MDFTFLPIRELNLKNTCMYKKVGKTRDNSLCYPKEHQTHYIALECSNNHAHKLSKLSLPEQSHHRFHPVILSPQHLTPTLHQTLQLRVI